MKEKNVWLSPEELQHMLQGSLLWIDVAPRLTASKTGIRKWNEAISEKQTVPKQSEQTVEERQRAKGKNSKCLEGQPVIWLLGSVGFLTISSWFYFVLFSK